MATQTKKSKKRLKEKRGFSVVVGKSWEVHDVDEQNVLPRQAGEPSEPPVIDGGLVAWEEREEIEEVTEVVGKTWSKTHAVTVIVLVVVIAAVVVGYTTGDFSVFETIAEKVAETTTDFLKPD